MNKAQIEISFNWIFVLIVGIVMLLFFFSMINAQQKKSEQRIDVSVAKHFDTIISTTTQRSGTVKSYALPPIELEFSCNSLEDVYSYSVNGLKARDIKYDVIFSPKKTESRNLQTWTLDWTVPFKVSTFLYLTTPEQAYVFWYNSDDPESIQASSKLLYDDFPSNFTKLQIHDYAPSDSTSGYENVTYVFDDALADSHWPFLKDNIEEGSRVIIIKPTDVNNYYQVGQIYYCYNYQTNNNYNNFKSTNCEATAYLGKASMYGAVLSDTLEFYNCGMKKAFKKFEVVGKLQELKISKAVDDASGTCKSILNGLGPAKGALGYTQDLNAELVNGFVPASIADVNTIIKSLEEKNRQLSFESNCPLIY